jgi:hypothetical protein
LAEASSLVSSDLRKSKFYPFKSALRISWTGASGTSGTLVLLLVFWYFVKLGFHFAEDLATEKVRSRFQIDP